jgi:hypothetical protein
MVRQIVLQHGGSIDVTSKPGQRNGGRRSASPPYALEQEKAA